jgi:transposase
VDTETGDYGERPLQHREEAEKFYRDLAAQGMKVRVGMEASGHARWFERLLAELKFELWIGDAAEIRTKRVRKQKTDREDARLLLEDRFPRIWVPSWENRDLRQLLWHRHRMVQARTRIMNQLQAVALNEGLRCKKRLWREHGRKQLESFPLAPWASRRRHDLLELLDRLNPTIVDLSQPIEQEVEKCPEARRLMTHPGVGPLTALAFVLIIGRGERFQCGKQIASYLGLVPLEESSGNRRRLARAHHETRKLDVAFLATARAEDRQGSYGPQISGSFVLGVAPAMGLRVRASSFTIFAGLPSATWFAQECRRRLPCRSVDTRREACSTATTSSASRTSGKRCRKRRTI